MNKSIKAFSLAEVLITLAVVGVVASLTIPSMIQNNNKTAYVTALQKAYSTLTNATRMIMYDKGVSNLAASGIFDSSSTSSSLLAEYNKYMPFSKNCGTGTGCWNPTGQKRISAVSSSLGYDSVSYIAKTITSDGMSIALQNFQKDCTDNEYVPSDTCGSIIVDINGLKAPNQIGRDTFYFYVLNSGKLVADGGTPGVMDDNNNSTYWKDHPDSCSTNPAGQAVGSTCGARVIEEGWRMTY